LTWLITQSTSPVVDCGLDALDIDALPKAQENRDAPTARSLTQEALLGAISGTSPFRT
jgi:hypothetical protein